MKDILNPIVRGDEWQVLGLPKGRKFRNRYTEEFKQSKIYLS
jgi:hypothetical protein